MLARLTAIVIAAFAWLAPATAQQLPANTIFGNPTGATAPGRGITSLPSGVTSNSTQVLNNAPGTGGLTRTQSAINREVVNLQDYAPGDGTNQTTAVQAAFTYAKTLGFPTIFVPCGNYLVTTTIDITGIGITGLGGCSQFSTTANVAILQDNNNTSSIVGVTRENFILVSSNATHTLDYGWTLTGTTVGNVFNYNTFRGIKCFGVKACLYFNKNVNSGGENQHDWNTITNIQTTNNGANQTDYGVLFQNGSGTGNIITNSNLVVGKAGVEYVATNGANVGDIVISGLQVGGTATDGCWVFPAAAAYRNRVSITASQCDGGPVLSIVSTNYSNVTAYGNNYGGSTATAMVGTSNSAGDFGGVLERRYGNNKTVTSTGVDAFFSITLQTNIYAAVMVELVVEGLVQGSGIQTRTSHYHIIQNGACAGISTTQLDSFAHGAGTIFTITNALATCTVTFSTSFPGGTTANSGLFYHARVVGGSFDAIMQ